MIVADYDDPAHPVISRYSTSFKNLGHGKVLDQIEVCLLRILVPGKAKQRYFVQNLAIHDCNCNISTYAMTHVQTGLSRTWAIDRFTSFRQ